MTVPKGGFADVVKNAQQKPNFRNFSQETTIHGFRYIGEDTSLWRKILWLILLVFCSVFLVKQVKEKWDDFQRSPIMTNIDIEYPTEMHFPAVVICNSNQYRITQTQGDLYNYITSHYTLADASIDKEHKREKLAYKSKHAADAPWHAAYQHDHETIRDIERSHDPDFEEKVNVTLMSDARAYLERTAHKIEDMLMWCVWPDGSVCTADDFSMIRTDYGICYTINSDKYKAVKVKRAGKLLYLSTTNGLRPIASCIGSFDASLRALQQYVNTKRNNNTVIAKNKKQKYANSPLAASDDPASAQFVLDGPIPGAYLCNQTTNHIARVQSGLSIGLNIEEYEQMAGPQKTVGLKVLIYNQTSLPMVAKKGIDVPPGFFSQIAVDFRQREKLGKDDGGNCVTGMVLNNMPADYEYTVDHCRVDKKIDAVKAKCNCTMFNSPGKATCTVEQHFACVESTQEPESIKECAENCTSVTYRPMLSMAMLPVAAIESGMSESERLQMARHYHAAMEAKSRLDAKEGGIVDGLVDALFELDTELWDQHWAPIRANYWETYERLMNDVPCYKQIINDFGLLIDQLQEKGEQFQKDMDELLPDEKIIYRLHHYSALELADKDYWPEIRKAHENETNMYRHALKHLFEMLTELTTDLGEEDLRGELVGGDIAEYRSLFNNVVRYEVRNITRLEFALNIGDFSYLISYYRTRVIEPLKRNVIEKLGRKLKMRKVLEHLESLKNETEQEDGVYFANEVLFGFNKNAPRDPDCLAKMKEELHSLYEREGMVAPSIEDEGVPLNHLLYNDFGNTKYPPPQSHTDMYGNWAYYPGMLDAYGNTIYPPEVEWLINEQTPTYAPYGSGGVETVYTTAAPYGKSWEDWLYGPSGSSAGYESDTSTGTVGATTTTEMSGSFATSTVGLTASVGDSTKATTQAPKIGTTGDHDQTFDWTEGPTTQANVQPTSDLPTGTQWIGSTNEQQTAIAGQSSTPDAKTEVTLEAGTILSTIGNKIQQSTPMVLPTTETQGDTLQTDAPSTAAAVITDPQTTIVQLKTDAPSIVPQSTAAITAPQTTIVQLQTDAPSTIAQSTAADLTRAQTTIVQLETDAPSTVAQSTAAVTDTTGAQTTVAATVTQPADAPLPADADSTDSIEEIAVGTGDETGGFPATEDAAKLDEATAATLEEIPPPPPESDGETVLAADDAAIGEPSILQGDEAPPDFGDYPPPDLKRRKRQVQTGDYPLPAGEPVGTNVEDPYGGGGGYPQPHYYAPPQDPAEKYNIDLFSSVCPVKTHYDLGALVRLLQTCMFADLNTYIEKLTQKVNRLERKLEPVAQMLENLREYKEEAATSDEFYQRNSLAINVYYQDLTKEILRQELSYNFWSLACDVGGTLGLFLGASIMTVFEVIDFFLLKPCMNRRKKGTAVANVSQQQQHQHQYPTEVISSMDHVPPLPYH